MGRASVHRQRSRVSDEGAGDRAAGLSETSPAVTKCRAEGSVPMEEGKISNVRLAEIRKP